MHPNWGELENTAFALLDLSECESPQGRLLEAYMDGYSSGGLIYARHRANMSTSFPASSWRRLKISNFSRREWEITSPTMLLSLCNAAYMWSFRTTKYAPRKKGRHVHSVSCFHGAVLGMYLNDMKAVVRHESCCTLQLPSNLN